MKKALKNSIFMLRSFSKNHKITQPKVYKYNFASIIVNVDDAGFYTVITDATVHKCSSKYVFLKF